MDMYLKLHEIRQSILMGTQRTNPFVHGVSKRAIQLSVPSKDLLWKQFVLEEKSIRISLRPVETVEEQTEQFHLLSEVSSAIVKVATLARNAERLVEERGYNLLRLCFGQVAWRTKEKSGTAPILFIPVHLHVAPHRSSIKLVHTGEPVQVNPALWELLEKESERDDIGDFGQLEDISDYTIEELEAVLQLIQKESVAVDWSVEETCSIDLIEATYAQISNDLKRENWSENSLSSLRGVFGEGFVVDHINQAVMEEKVTEQIRQAERVPYIVEADPAQSKAIAIASMGENLVIQGPPGTGKSQTIANIIAICASQNKKVLFVAQKKAALDVVYQRLVEANLKYLILELHSSKSKRVKVIKSLKEAYQQKNISEQIDKELPKIVREQREKIEAQNTLLQKNVGNTNKNLSDIFSDAQCTDDRIPKIQHCPLALTWSESQIQSLEDHSIEFVQQIQSEDLSWKDNPFANTQISTTKGVDIEMLFEELGRFRTDIQLLKSIMKKQEEQIGCRVVPTLSGVRAIEGELFFLSKKPEISTLNVNLLGLSDHLALAHELLAKGKSLSLLHTRLLSFFQPSSLFLHKEISTQLQLFEEYKPKWWRVFLPKWWKAQRLLGVYVRDDVECSVEELSKPIDELEDFHEKNLDFEMNAEWGARFFRSSWKGIFSNWESLYEKIHWYEESKSWLSAHPSIQQKSFYRLSTLPQTARDIASDLQECRKRIERRIEYLAGVLQPLAKHPLHLSDTRELELILEWVLSPHLHREALARAVAVHQVCRPLYENDLFAWIDWLEQCPDSSFVQPTWRHTVYYSRMQVLLHQADTYAMTKTGLKTIRERFIQNDQQLFRLAQEKLALKHVQSICSLLPVGQMRVLTEEFGRRRKGNTIRRMMQDCPQAIQRLKPIFMMSPMSVATNLPPEHIEFDVVIFDEASQMTTPFALGSLLRGAQAIVVGDQQQLSPSNFFTGINESESILDRFLASGCPSVQLSFHYRSRHPDLISISNRFMYTDQLRPFPSPLTHPLAKGVRFVSSVGSLYGRGTTRNNPVEAKILVQEVIDTFQTTIAKGCRPSVGIVAFSIAQRDAIQDVWDEEIVRYPDVEDYLQSLAPSQQLFIKNLESVQGDERDIIFISIGYGLDKDNRFTQGFGPVTKSGGEKRLNVLFSRARYEMVLFANFEPRQIQATSTARKMLKEMLLLSKNGPVSKSLSSSNDADGFVQDICSFIVSCGYIARPFYGPKGNTIDIAVAAQHNPDQYYLAILCENGDWAQSISTRYQERQFAAILHSMDWEVYRMWSFPWYQNPSVEKAELKKRLEKKVSHTVPSLPFTLKRLEHRRALVCGWTRRQFIQEEKLSIEVGLEPKENPKKMRTLTIQILNVEGPLSFDMLARRISGLLKVKNTKKNRTAVEDILISLQKKKRVQSKEGFYWTKDTPMELVLPNGRFREPDEVYPPHLRKLVHFYLSGSVTGMLSLEEVSTLLLQQLGWKSISAKKRDDIKAVLRTVLSRSTIGIKDGVLYLT